MNSIRISRSLSILTSMTLAGLALPSSAGEITTQDNLCADNGHCHLDRWLPSSVGDLQQFGQAVALNEDGLTAAVGLPGSDQVKIYGLVDGIWNVAQTIHSPGGPDAEFGSDVKFFGEKLVIGAPGDDQTHPDAGAAHVFARSGGPYHFEQTLFSPIAEPDGRFGASVDGQGLWLAVGEPGGGNGGRAIAFRQTGALYILHDVLDILGSGGLGNSVAIDGNSIALGAAQDSSLGANAGAVFVFSLSLTSQTGFTEVLPSDGMAGDAFGISVDFDNERLIVGSQGHDAQANNGGAAYLFAKTIGGMGATYDEIEKFLPCDAEEFAFFGNHVAIDGGRVVVGAHLEDGTLEPGGKAYVYRETGVFSENWTIEEQLRAADGSLNDHFGCNVAVAGDRILIGADGVDEMGSASGAAYFFSLSNPEYGGGACLCDIVAGVESFGAGKPGASGIPELGLNKPLSLGAQSLLGTTNLTPGTAPFLVWGFQPASIPFDGGTLHMSDPHLIALPIVTAFGQVGMPIELGLAPAVCGVEVLMQVFVVDPGATGDYMTAQSNGLSVRVGQ